MIESLEMCGDLDLLYCSHGQSPLAVDGIR